MFFILLCITALSSLNVYATSENTTYRPWGYYTILSQTPDYKIKEIGVNPHKRLSLQRHKHRAEHWIILEGKGLVTLNGEHINVVKGSMVHVRHHDIHRIENTGDTLLVFIEVQTGSYFGEDDIERLEDDFGRV